jgi:amino acid adenylation domain-containing protein
VTDVLQGILDQVRSGPELPAVQDLERALTYGQLRDEVARLGAGLVAHGVGEGDRVALLLPNSVDFVVAALASLWIGAVFVPLAVSDPEVRLAAIVADCAPVIVVIADDAEQAPALSPSLVSPPCVSIGELRASAFEPTDPVPAGPRVAYVIYTSGTTGTPKGVQIGTEAFAAAVRSTSQSLSLERTTRTLCVSPFHFDGSFGTLFPTLYCGGSVVIRPRGALLFPRTFFNTVSAENITYTGFSPSYLRLLLASPQMAELADSRLEVIALGGEASSLADIRLLWSWAPALKVFNRYGPTETAIAVTHVLLSPEMTEGGVVPIGRPHPGVSFHLLGDDGSIVKGPDGVGELFIGGIQLMDGYLGDPGLTSQVLRDDVVPGEVVYRTGDLVYRDQSGNYVYVDRNDRVIKRSGVRLSLIELSHVMGALEGVAGAACVTFDNEGELGVAAFVVAPHGDSVLELLRAAKERLPDTMLPDRIELVESLPLNESSKLDERSLLASAGLRPMRAVTVEERPPRV